MAVNVPSLTTDDFSFGPGILSLVAITAAGVTGVAEATDFVDVGGVRSGASFSVSRTRLDVFQGSPKALQKTFVTEESAELTVNGIEWNLSQLADALGAGVVSGSGAQDSTTTFKFGGDLNVSDVAAKFVHVMPTGDTITIKLWKAQGAGDLSVTFGDDLHEIPYTMKAQEAGAFGWDALALATTERLFSITIVR